MQMKYQLQLKFSVKILIQNMKISIKYMKISILSISLTE